MASDNSPPAASNNAAAVDPPSPSVQSESADAASPESLASPAPKQPAMTRGKGRARGRLTQPRGKAAQRAVKKPAGTGRGRGNARKWFDSLKEKSAHERQAAVKSQWIAVAKAARVGNQDLTNRQTTVLQRDTHAHERNPEYEKVTEFLQHRKNDAISTITAKKDFGLLNTHDMCYGNIKSVEDGLDMQLAEKTYERYGTNLLQLQRLEYLYDNNLPLDHPLENKDEYKSVSQWDADHPGAYVTVKDGVEIPFPGKAMLPPLDKVFDMPDMPASKRAAEGQPEGQPGAKRAATTAIKKKGPNRPIRRRGGGLLGGVKEIPRDESKSPESPASAEVAAEVAAEAAAGTPSSKGEGQEPSIPRGATEPDEYGTRVVHRKTHPVDSLPRNRIMIKPHAEYTFEIGFSETSNNPDKGATRARRGRYLGTPNSNYWCYDRYRGDWDCTRDTDFDEELVKKHKLHPKFGLFLHSSVNMEEPPKQHANPLKPVVFVAPNGKKMHTSRSAQLVQDEKRAQELERKIDMAEALKAFCAHEAISLSEDAEKRANDGAVATKDVAEKEKDTQDAADVAAKAASAEHVVPAPVPEEDKSSFTDAVELLLRAAEEEPVRAAKPSRPYDVVRDVFIGSSPPAQAPAALPVDTRLLSLLADEATRPKDEEKRPSAVNRQRDMPTQWSQHANMEAYHRSVSMGMGPPGMLHQHYARPGPNIPQTQPQPERTRAPPAAPQPKRSSDFLRTVVNPPTSASSPYACIAPAPTQPSHSVHMPAQSVGRTPFTSTGVAPPALPALRPVRSILNDTPPLLNDPGRQPIGTYYATRPRLFSDNHTTSHLMSGQKPLAMPMQGPGPAMNHHYHMAQSGYAPPPLAPVHMQGPHLPAMSAPSSAPSLRPCSRPKSSSSMANNNDAMITGNDLMGGTTTGKGLRTIFPRPTPPHRLSGLGSSGADELKTVHFNHKSDIKDYRAVEDPPRHGPTQIRGWTHNNVKKFTRASTAKAAALAAAKGGNAPGNVGDDAS